MSIKGQTSNHGMQQITRQDIEKQQQELVDKNKGHSSSCPYCGETFTLNKKEYITKDAAILTEHFRKNKCPYCKLEKSMEFHGVVMQHTFTLNLGREISCIRKPEGFKGIKKVKTYEEQKGKPYSYNIK